ncbi:MAG: pyruvate dehydrogenase (acetyl-transferring) E1 component subunit alpha [Chlamydiales bacterium]|nr:pyruvate dehydrogenase (acetyl-transferring) E1 component subunit alpha [Chlamydiales bacterium]
MKSAKSVEYHYFPHETEKLARAIGEKRLLDVLKSMLLIRNFEIRAESAYQQGKVGGFFHSYMGQEAIATAAFSAMGRDQWWAGSYRCHALALLSGASPNELMAELYGKVTGNAKGRGGSMHFFTDRLLGGFGIVGGQIPIATGAAFAVKYSKSVKMAKPMPACEVAVCFFGEGAVAQGAFHESLNLASLWDLPAIYVIENNQWGMGTGVDRAICVKPIAEKKGPSFDMQAYTLDGMDFFNCIAGFQHIYEQIKKDSRPVIVEAITERFRGHSISDPALYRAKEDLKQCMERDPLIIMFKTLAAMGMITEAEYQAMDKEQKDIVVAAMKYAEESPWPDPIELGEDVFAPERS